MFVRSNLAVRDKRAAITVLNFRPLLAAACMKRASCQSSLRPHTPPAPHERSAPLAPLAPFASEYCQSSLVSEKCANDAPVALRAIDSMADAMRLAEPYDAEEEWCGFTWVCSCHSERPGC